MARIFEFVIHFVTKPDYYYYHFYWFENNDLWLLKARARLLWSMKDIKMSNILWIFVRYHFFENWERTEQSNKIIYDTTKLIWKDSTEFSNLVMPYCLCQMTCSSVGSEHSITYSTAISECHRILRSLIINWDSTIQYWIR